MKILFTGYHNPHFKTITEYVEKALLSLGHEVISFDDRQYLLPGRLRAGIPLFEQLEIARMNRGLRALARKAKPDLCLAAG